MDKSSYPHIFMVMEYNVNKIDKDNYVVIITSDNKMMGELHFNKISEGYIMDVWGCSNMRLEPQLFDDNNLTPKEILRKSKSLVEFEEYPYAQEPTHNVD